jgi:hypothetical protein
MNINIIINNGILDGCLEPPERKVLCQVNREFRLHFTVPERVTVSVSQRVKTVADFPLAFHQGLRPTHTIVCAIARSGSLEVLQHLQSVIGPEIHPEIADELTCAIAAMHGNLEFLQWLHANGCPWDSGTSSHAAKAGQLEILQWARTNGCPWDHHTCRAAAMAGHLEILQWLRANGCPWDKTTCEFATRHGHFHIFQWALSNGCPNPLMP